MYRLLYRKQDSLGLKRWESYAAEAGVRDIASFVSCAESTEPIARLRADTLLARNVGVRGTPTIII